MINELIDCPGLVITDKVSRTTKVKKFIEKNKLNDYKVLYLENPSEDFREVERALKELENQYLGIAPPKPKYVEERNQTYEYTYRINYNTILCAHSMQELNLLKKWYNYENKN